MDLKRYNNVLKGEPGILFAFWGLDFNLPSNEQSYGTAPAHP